MNLPIIINLRIYLIFILISTQCISQEFESIENSIEKCVNEKMEEYCKEFIDCKIDFYALSIEIENSLIKSNLLEKNSKNGYLKLIKKFSSDRKIFKDEIEKIQAIMWENKFEGNSFILISQFTKKCPNKVIIEYDLGENSLLYNQILTIDKLEANGMEGIQLLYSFIEKIDNEEFNKIVFRAPILFLVYKVIQNEIENL